jgi:hypothetical protein
MCIHDFGAPVAYYVRCLIRYASSIAFLLIERPTRMTTEGSANDASLSSLPGLTCLRRSEAVLDADTQRPASRRQARQSIPVTGESNA